MKSFSTKLFIFPCLIFLLGGCLKNTDQPTIDLPSIEEYLTTNNITAEEDPSGLYYVITEEGTGDKPTLSNEVTVKYTGRLTDDRVFDSSGNREVSFKLNNLIEGWQIGFQLLKEGSKATLYIPSNLGYGSRGVPGTIITPNAPLVFDVELVSFK